MRLSEKTRRNIRLSYVVYLTVIGALFFPCMRASSLGWMVLLFALAVSGAYMLDVVRNRSVSSEVPGYPLFKGQSVPSDTKQFNGCIGYFIGVVIVYVGRIYIDLDKIVKPIFDSVFNTIHWLSVQTHIPQLFLLSMLATVSGLLLGTWAGNGAVKEIEASLGRRLRGRNMKVTSENE